jgi:hypothetical protein
VILLGWGSAVAGAQSTGPVFELQPGLQTYDFYSVADDVTSSSAFLIRLQARFPTGIGWWQPIVGVSFTPYGTTGNDVRDTDAPTLYAGNVFTLMSSRRTSGWLTLELPLLLAHSPGAGPTGNVRDFGRDVIVQPTARFHIGERLFGDFGVAWSRFELLLLLEQNLTPNRDRTTGRRDRLNPVAVFGATLRFGGAQPE